MAMTIKADEREHYRGVFDRRESKMNGDNFAGLEYDTELAGPGGCSVLLFVTKDTTDEQLRKAKDEARHKNDVVSFLAIRIPDEWLKCEEYTPDETHKGGWTEAMRWIHDNHKCRRIDPDTGALIPDGKRGGVLVDAFTASGMVQVYDALNETNQKKFGDMPVAVAVDIMWKLTKKGR